MDKLTINGLIEVEGMRFHDIEGGFGEGKKAMLVKDIAEIHGKEIRQINENINAYRKRFADGVDIIDLLGIAMSDTEIIALGFTQQAINSYRGLKQKGLNSGIYILSERGYAKLLKILEDDLAWEQYEKLVGGYFDMKAQAKTAIENLSPQLQLLINMELKQAELQKQMDATNKLIEDNDKKIQTANEKIDGIRDIVALNPVQWRKDTTNIINKIAAGLGDYIHIKAIREESYKLLDERFGVSLNIRLTNKRKTLALNGTCKSKIDKINQLDVIGEDRKLVEGYISIVKELAIKYGAAI